MKSFIQSIEILKVRHLENIHIPLSQTEPKHLILTGKNGSGKTSVLEKLRDFLSYNVQQQHLLEIPDIEETLSKLKEQLRINTQTMLEAQIQSYEKLLDTWGINNLKVNFINPEGMLQSYRNGEFILGYFGAERADPNINMEIPDGPIAFTAPKIYPIIADAKKNFLQYLVNLIFKQARAGMKQVSTVKETADDIDISQKIETWFLNFEKMLQTIFSDKNLKLVFDDDKLNFKIKFANREGVGFDELSSGYSAFIRIVIDIIMRMMGDKTSNGIENFNVEGIILIDEIDVHLHIDLQKQILPFLTTFFPNIQFIVTTHSPFVLSSIENAVIYDLENKILVENLSGYSYDGIVENYFEIGKYSEIINDKFSRYKNLKERFTSLSNSEKHELNSLEEYLNNIKYDLAPELAALMLQLK